MGEQVGRVLAELDRRKLLDSTVVIFIGDDNGYDSENVSGGTRTRTMIAIAMRR